ncbi:MAG: matrixin family metalloprotease [Bacteriovoracia bacterium]
MKPAIILLSLAFLASCVPSKTVESEVNGGNINVSAPYLWSIYAFPRNLKISDDFTAQEVTNIQSMTAAWETAVEDKKNFFNDTERTTEVSSPSLNLDSLGDDNVNGVYKITSWPMELSAGALAVTQLFGRRYNVGSSSEFVRIEHADILLNENLYDFRTGDSGVSGSFDLRTVMLHELGHFLGLSHKYGNTVMVPSIGTSTVARAPTGVDALDIADKYGITLGGGGAAAMAAGTQKTYVPQDSGQKVKIMIELMADGECVHKENGAVTRRHFLK